MDGDRKTTRAPSNEGFRLPKPSLRIPIVALVIAGLSFGALAATMSDVGHATGAAIGAVLFLLSAGYIGWQSRQ